MKILAKMKYAIVAVVVLTACDFGDTNLNPTSVSGEQVTLPLILPKAEIQSAYNIAATGGRIAGIWMQYFEGVEAQQNAITNYNSDEADVNNTWEFQLYVGAMRDNINIIEKATEEGNESPYYAGIGRILLAHNLSFATQLWGDIPYSEAFQGSDNLNPVFDTQQEVFAAIQGLLDQAIANLQEPAAGVIPGADDLIFGGDIDSWIATARSLKARNFVILSKRNGTSAYTDALAQINAGVLTDADDGQPDFDFGTATADANPVALFETDRAATLQLDPTFADVILNGDPRSAVYFDNSGALNAFAGTTLFWGRNQSPLPLISYSEVKFIEAEALLMTGDIAGAEVALNEAIKSNMHQVGVDSSSAAVSTYLGTNASLAGLATTNARQDRVISEKYKALYVQGMVEIWSDYRRTGFPGFISPEPGAAESILPRRLVYPQQENLTNAENVAAATARQGGATLVDDMWAFE
ncbi:SusD/RagB family nutrient-binding outer membrane lipoprotein [Ekhidna lutea]|nr:SusD/RagB family nutrient-binding outer membrane lipoprotein [Ekhidna lutea]